MCIYTVFRVRSFLGFRWVIFGCVLSFPFDAASGGLVDRRRLDVAGSVCLEDIIGRLEVFCCFSQSPVPSFAPDKQFFKLLQMLHYRDSIRVSKDILVLLLLVLLLFCPLPIFLLLWIFIFFACFYLLHPLLVSSSVLYLFPILQLHFYYC